jgi:molecular chaperone DnaK (HSP70)
VGDPILGLDLGSTKACVAAVDGQGLLRLIADAHGDSIIPAVVSFAADGHVLIGRAALERRAEDPQNTLPAEIRPGAPALPTRAGRMGPTDLTSILLDHLRRMADTSIHSDTRKVILTAPLTHEAEYRAELLRAAGLGGLAVEGILAAPLASVFAFGNDKQRSQRVAVVDAGAAKLECAIVDVGGGAAPRLVGHGSAPGLGGRAFDERLTAWLADGAMKAFGFDPRTHPWVIDRLRAAAEQAKRQLAVHGQYGVHVEVPAIARGADGSATDLRLLLDWNVFQATCMDLVDQMAQPCVQALSAAGIDATGISQLLLVGGTARLPPVQERLGQLFGRAPRMDVAPDAAPALGAAIFASRGELSSARVTNPYGAVSPPPAEGIGAPQVGAPASQTRVGRVSTKKMFTAVMQAASAPEVSFSAPRLTPPTASPPAIIEVTATRLGLSTVAGFCDEIIPRDVPVPAARTRVFSTGRDGQRAVTLSVCEGDSRRFGENRPLGTLVLDDLPPRPRGQVRIAVTFSIDADGILKAAALNEGTGRAQKIQIRLPPRA